MALPPIITNSPLFRFFKSDRATVTDVSTKTPPAGGNLPEDVVEISAAATQKLESAKAAEIKTPEEARDTAAQTRQLLENETAPLGLGPAFT